MCRIYSKAKPISSDSTYNDTLSDDRFPLEIKNQTTAVWNGIKFTLRTLYETPAEAAAFAIAAIVMRIFVSSLVAPLAGICTSLIFSRLAVKILDQYYNVPLVQIKKQVCILYKKYPKLQLVAFISALAISLLSPTAGFVIGLTLGAFGAIILDVENYKLIQKAKRDKQDN